MGLIVGLFFIIALCYASAGFGGGSSYTALLLFRGEEPEVIRMVSLSCNLVVAGIGGWMSLRAQRVRGKLMGPLLLSSIPGTWLGARMTLAVTNFEVIIGLALLVAGGLLLFNFQKSKIAKPVNVPLLVILGAGLGMLAGVTGIGGGIYLVPVLHLLRAGPAKEVAAVGTWFIIVNSAVGLATLSWQGGVEPLREFAWLPVAVAAGGMIGARLLQGFFNGPWIRRVTGVLVLGVALRVLF